MGKPEIKAATLGLPIVVAPVVIITLLAHRVALRKDTLAEHAIAARALDLFGAEA